MPNECLKMCVCVSCSMISPIHDVCLQCLEESIARHSGMKDDLHVPPFALFEIASIHMQKPEVIFGSV